MDLCVVGEQLVASGLLFVGEQVGAEERPAGDVRRVAGASPATAGVLLDAPPALVQGFTGQPNDMDGVHHRNRGGELFAGGGLLAGEPGYRGDLHRVAPRLRAVGEPGLEGLLGAVPTPGRPRRPTGQRRTQSPSPSNVKSPFAGSCTASGSGQHQLLAQQPVQTRRPRRLEHCDATGVRHDSAVRRVELNTG